MFTSVIVDQEEEPPLPQTQKQEIQQTQAINAYDGSGSIVPSQSSIHGSSSAAVSAMGKFEETLTRHFVCSHNEIPFLF